MTSRLSEPAALFLPYRKILPEGYQCPEPKHRREDMLQDIVLSDTNHLIRDYCSNRPHTLVDGGGFVFYDTDDMRRRRIRPDLYVVFGVDTGSVLGRGGYIIEEAGKPPDWALEIASPSTYRRDTGEKRELYKEIGVGEYWRFDATGGRLYGYPLAGDILVDGAYQSIEMTLEEDGMLWGYSPALDLCLCALNRELLYYDRKTGHYLQTARQERAARQQAAAERDTERAARQQAAAERDTERAARQQAAAERDTERAARQQAAAERDTERAARQQAAAERDTERAARQQAAAEVERLQEELRRLRGQ